MDHDIIVVGSGPAGLSTGLHLAQLAPALAERTLILERERHPRQVVRREGYARRRSLAAETGA